MREHTLGGRFVLSFFWRRSPECGGDRGDHPQNGGGETEGGAHYLGEPEGGAHHPEPAVWNDPWRHTCKHTVSKNIIKHGKNVDQCGPTPLMPLLAWARLGYATTSVGLPRLCRCRGQATIRKVKTEQTRHHNQAGRVWMRRLPGAVARWGGGSLGRLAGAAARWDGGSLGRRIAGAAARWDGGSLGRAGGSGGSDGSGTSGALGGRVWHVGQAGRAGRCGSEEAGT